MQQTLEDIFKRHQLDNRSFKGEQGNVALAEKIALTNDKNSLEELISIAQSAKATIASDAIKVIYEAAERSPKLVKGLAGELTGLLASKNNRMQWGAMTALSHIANEVPQQLYENIYVLEDIAAKGSVITMDHYVNILL